MGPEDKLERDDFLDEVWEVKEFLTLSVELMLEYGRTEE